jgi:hypothetical protein
MSDERADKPIARAIRPLLVAADQRCPAIIGQAHLLYYAPRCDAEGPGGEMRAAEAGRRRFAQSLGRRGHRHEGERGGQELSLAPHPSNNPPSRGSMAVVG